SRRTPVSTLFPYTTLFRSNGSWDRVQAPHPIDETRSVGFVPSRASRDRRAPPPPPASAQVSARSCAASCRAPHPRALRGCPRERSEEHTSELQSRENLVCR